MDMTMTDTGQPFQSSAFEGYVECSLFSEDAEIMVGEDSLLLAARFDQFSIPYGEIIGFSLSAYKVEIRMREGCVEVSRMGQSAQWLYDKLYAAYNETVLKALLVDGTHRFETEGRYTAEESGKTRQGKAVIRLYEDCLCILPPDEGARRIPLCFLIGAENKEFSLTLILSTGERFTLYELGRELDELDRQLTNGLRALREQTAEWFKELAPNLTSMQAALAVRMAPLGTAAELEELSAAALPLAAALELKIGDSRAAETYSWLSGLCGGHGLMVGSLPPRPKAPELQSAVPTELPNADDAPLAKPVEDDVKSEMEEMEPKPVLWVIAPDKSCNLAAVELALADNEETATYLYRVDGDWKPFARIIDRALEATGFRREMILLPEDKLNMPEYLETAMLVRRTPALARLRACFAGRAIHSSHDRWKRDIEKYLAQIPVAAQEKEPIKAAKFCTNCGAGLALNVKFCGFCGTKQQ